MVSSPDTLIMRNAVLLVCLLLVAGCEANTEAILRTTEVKVGMTEQEALAIAGVPMRTTLDIDFPPCKEAGGVRMLLYFHTSSFLGRMEQTHGAVVLCVDARGIIVDTAQLDY